MQDILRISWWYQTIILNILCNLQLRRINTTLSFTTLVLSHITIMMAIRLFQWPIMRETPLHQNHCIKTWWSYENTKLKLMYHDNIKISHHLWNSDILQSCTLVWNTHSVLALQRWTNFSFSAEVQMVWMVLTWFKFLLSLLLLYIHQLIYHLFTSSFCISSSSFDSYYSNS